MNDWIKWFFFGITIVVFIVAVVFITRAFRTQCPSESVYDSKLNKCIPVCPQGEKYYPEIDSCSKCPLGQEYNDTDNICKETCPIEGNYENCGTQCYRPAQEKCYQDLLGNYKICYNNQYYENNHLVIDPSGSSYVATTRTLTLKMDNSEFGKIKEGDTLIVNDDTTLSGVVDKILPNNNQVILKATSSGDSPFHDIASPNLTSCSVKGSFCCEDGTYYDSTSKKCVKCTIGICEGKCLDPGYECVNNAPCPTANIVYKDDGSKICCDDPNRICGKECCSIGKVCIPSGPYAGQCGIKCGDGYCPSSQSCFVDKINNQNLCLSSECVWSSPLAYTPDSLNNEATCKDNSGNLYFCNAGQAQNQTRTATNFACDPNITSSCAPFTDISKNKCSASDCQKRMSAFGVFENDYEFDSNKLTCSAKFDCQKLPTCDNIQKSSGGATGYTGLPDYSLCKDSQGKLTGQYCTKGSCIDGKCGTFSCNPANGNCEFKQGDFTGFQSLDDCKNQPGGCVNLCAACGSGVCTLSADRKSVSSCSSCPTTGLQQTDGGNYNYAIDDPRGAPKLIQWTNQPSNTCNMCAASGTVLYAPFTGGPDLRDKVKCCGGDVQRVDWDPSLGGGLKGYQCP
jgi:hypothetical protein